MCYDASMVKNIKKVALKGLARHDSAESKMTPRQINLEKISFNATHWIGSTESLIVHTLLFIGVLSLSLLGFNFDRILLVLTTVLSFEAIYLAIFIQMTVNRNTIQLHEVGKDIEEISEDIEDIQEDVVEISEDIEEIQEDVEEISEDIEDIQEDVEEISDEGEETEKEEGKIALAKLEKTLALLLKEITQIKKK